MNELNWNDGMSVGVDAIDQDHKQLLKLINEINTAINNGSTELIIKDIFRQLEHYVKQHFTREEALLQQCNYPDYEEHKLQHQQFINKIPELRERLLSAETIEVAQEVSLFLLNWIMNHIVVDDMSYAKLVHEQGLTTNDRSTPSWSERIKAWVGRQIKLDNRIYLGMIIPLFGLLVLSASVVTFSYQYYQNAKQVIEVTGLLNAANKLSHTLQIERGLTTATIGSNFERFSSELLASRVVTDKALSNYRERVMQIRTGSVADRVSQQLADTDIALAELNQQRGLVNSKTSHISNTQQYYTQSIKELISVLDGLLSLGHNADLTRNTLSLSALVNMKEVVGLKRAIGAWILSGQSIDSKLLKDFYLLQGSRSGLLTLFMNSATIEQKNKWQKVLSSSVYRQAVALETQLERSIASQAELTIDSEHWFEVMTGKINAKNAFIEQLILDNEKNVQKELNSIQFVFVVITSLLLVLVFFSTVISWLLGHSIIYPIHLMTHAMKCLSEGQRDKRFTLEFADDQMREMFASYEVNRRKLLQADIISAIRFERQAMSIKQQEIDKKRLNELASIDPLTGAINRRKFQDVAYQELERARRCQQQFSILMLDIDYFKKVNDTYGHACGDEVLKVFCQTCMSQVREYDCVARIGGEEFAILLPQSDKKGAILLAERLRLSIEKTIVDYHGHQISITVSIGVAMWQEQTQDVQELLEQADKAVYQAKNLGRNQVRLFNDSPDKDVSLEH
ncbi:bacteriohemerythrin [Psychrobium sp. 1_MG-2023]|uniref:bacteriohemerythrin n=1 Tax=Psychrobium sp. 1_MG-2023 TaxID=3062624 RepID=UPI002735D910|nr:bacteriohemerythrin [Psychrobium sp. 1_MG-2023]MDP2560559.1 bacteriohemerythrin [Psychrobium sp. 1_MG-2023]